MSMKPTASGIHFDRPIGANPARPSRCLAVSGGGALGSAMSPFDRIRAVRTSGLKPTERLVLYVLSSYANAEGRCWPSLPTISTASGLNERSVRRGIERLVISGDLAPSGHGPHGSNAYIVQHVDRESTWTESPPGQRVHVDSVSLDVDRESTKESEEESKEEETTSLLQATTPAKPVVTTPAPCKEPSKSGRSLLLTTQRKALAAAGLDTPAAVAALTRTELGNREGIGPKSVDRIAAWLASQGLALRPEAPKAPKPNAKPYTDAWGLVWLSRRGTKYQFGEWHRSSADAAGLAEACGHDIEVYRRCCEAFHDLIDAEDWLANPPTLGRARQQSASLLNAMPRRSRGTYTPPSDEERARNTAAGERLRARLQQQRTENR